MKKNNKKLMVVGVDEAGRGPLAGPLAVGAAVLFIAPHKLSFWDRVRDSKKLSKKERAEIFIEIKKAKKEGKLDYACSMVGQEIIDRFGLTKAARLGVARALLALSVPKKRMEVLLDGSLYAPRGYKQKTIIHGDDIYKIIGLASIVAKETRDKKMKKLAEKYPEYGFEIHSGYGTKFHYRALRKNGPSPIHRRLFLRSLKH